MTQIAEPPTQSTADVFTATPLTMVQALNRALHDAMAGDDRVLVFGEDVATLGGVFRVTEGSPRHSDRSAVSIPRWLSPR
jgi:2-oxoisovalerate dehydrogenase E1 component beta subunit